MKSISKNIWLFSVAMLLFNACSENNSGKVVKMAWDRDTCVRCVMLISNRGYAVQIENPITNKRYKFDDIGCTISWFYENSATWFNKANIWVTDEKTHEWINAREALWTTGNITPMNFQLAAYSSSTLPKGKKSLTFKEAISYIKKNHFKNKKG